MILCSYHFRYPPNKRPNYQKLGIADPFGFAWQKIVNEWNLVVADVLQKAPELSQILQSSCKEKAPDAVDTVATMPNTVVMPNDASSPTQDGIPSSDATPKGSQSDFYVLRDCKLLYAIRNTFSLNSKLHHQKKSSKITTEQDGSKINLLASLLRDHHKAIVLVSFQCVGRGEITNDAMISIPTQEDLNALKKDSKFSGPTEPLHRGLKSSFPAVADSFDVSRSRVKSIGLCTRWAFGHVTSGRYSLACGKSAGLGFVSLAGLITCLSMQMSIDNGCRVLLRNGNSRQYRIARMDVVLP